MRAIPADKRVTKEVLGELISAELGIEQDRPVRSQGTVLVGFLEGIIERLGGDPDQVQRSYSNRTYDLLGAALGLCGLDLDLRAHTSAEAPTGGGGTVTGAGLAELLRGVQRFRGARYFIVNETDNPVSAKYADEPGRSYGFDDTVSGRVALLGAGGDARLVFYRTSKSSVNPKTFVAHAAVEEIVPRGHGAWTALLREYQVLPSPVPRDAVAIEGWNSQVSITEVCRRTYDGILSLSGSAPPIRSRAGLRDEDVAELLSATVRLDAPVHGVFAPLAADKAPIDPVPLGSPAGDVTAAGTRWRGGTRKSDKAAERRAVDIASKYLATAGWTLLRDAQADGVGYDLEFGRGEERLLVEVKGIQGPHLRFNMTAREWQRAETHPEFIVVAVTRVLQDDFEVHVLQQPDLFGTRRVVTQYRVDATAKSSEPA